MKSRVLKERKSRETKRNKSGRVDFSPTALERRPSDLHDFRPSNSPWKVRSAHLNMTRLVHTRVSLSLLFLLLVLELMPPKHPSDPREDLQRMLLPSSWTPGWTRRKQGAIVVSLSLFLPRRRLLPSVPPEQVSFFRWSPGSQSGGEILGVHEVVPSC